LIAVSARRPERSRWRRCDPHELPPALTSAFARPGAKLIEVMVDGSL